MIAALYSDKLASIPIGFVNSENIKQKLKFLFYFLEDRKVCFNNFIFISLHLKIVVRGKKEVKRIGGCHLK